LLAHDRDDIVGKVIWERFEEVTILHLVGLGGYGYPTYIYGTSSRDTYQFYANKLYDWAGRYQVSDLSAYKKGADRIKTQLPRHHPP
jgi:hypothetical protein